MFVVRLHRLWRLGQRWSSTARRVNPLGVQMLSSTLHKQLFRSEPISSKVNEQKSRNHLNEFQLKSSESEVLDDIEFKLPPLKSPDLDEHFRLIAKEQSAPYVELISQLAKSAIPPQPEKWLNRKGWTKCVGAKCSFDPFSRFLLKIFVGRRNACGGISRRESARLRCGNVGSRRQFRRVSRRSFTHELVRCSGEFSSPFGILSRRYSWCSSRLIDEEFRFQPTVELNDMIPMEADPSAPSLIIGHNVAFDRTYIKEQYRTSSSAMRFLDTMSLHIMCSGFTHAQRLQYQAFEKGGLNEEMNEDELEAQQLAMLLTNEKEKDMKAYAKMRQNKVKRREAYLDLLVSCLCRTFAGEWKVV